MTQQQQQVQIKKKYIIFRNPNTGDIITEVEVPKYIKLTHTEVCDLQSLRNRLKMLYIDVLCRGFHPVKGFQSEARNVFKHADIADDEKSLSKNVNLITIANNEAIGTIWRCLAREIGRPIKNYNMKQVQLQIVGEMRKLRGKPLTDVEMRNFNEKQRSSYLNNQKQAAKLEQQIVQQMAKIAHRCKIQDGITKNTRNHIAKVMGQQIIELQKDIFLKTLIGIKQCQMNTELVEFVMQQSYPYIRMSKKKAIQLLTEPVFNEKWQKYQLLIQKYEIQEDQVLLICHRCLIPVNILSRAANCNDEMASLNVGYSLLTDPYMYSRQVINQNCWEKDCRKYMHPYLIYYALGDNERAAVCNRYYCNKCEGLETGLFTNGQCGFCEGICDCLRCQGMDFLTKMMAVYVDNGGNLKAITDGFLMNFDTKLLETKNKKNLKTKVQKQYEFQQLYENFFEQKIFIKKKQLQNFEKIQYFPQRIEEQAKQKYQKYKMSKIKLQQSKIDRLERNEKQYKQKMQIQKWNNILSNCKPKKKQMDEKQGRQRNSQRNTAGSKEDEQFQSRKQINGIHEPNSNDKYSVYDDSDS